MLFYSLFKSLINERVVVELKSDLAITGTIKAVDQYLNIQLIDTQVAEANMTINPSLMMLGDCFIRGSMIRYVQLPPGSVDTELLKDSTRLEAQLVSRGDDGSSTDNEHDNSEDSVNSSDP